MLLEMRVERDWRVVRADDGQGGIWFVQDQEREFEERLKEVAGDTEPTARTLNVFGRQLAVPWASGGVCKFTFSELCLEVKPAHVS